MQGITEFGPECRPNARLLFIFEILFRLHFSSNVIILIAKKKSAIIQAIFLSNKNENRKLLTKGCNVRITYGNASISHQHKTWFWMHILYIVICFGSSLYRCYSSALIRPPVRWFSFIFSSSKFSFSFATSRRERMKEE